MKLLRRLTSSEELMMVDDRSAYPACFFVRMRFSGCLNRSAFESAICLGLQRHPLLRALVVESWYGFAWRILDDPKPAIVWLSDTAALRDVQIGRIDLRTEIGVRFYVVADGEGADMLVQCHHATSDARGLLQFLHDLLAAYADTCDGSHTRVPAGRTEDVVPRVGLWRTLPYLAAGIRHGWITVRRVPAPLLPHFAASNASEPGYGYPSAISEKLSKTDTAAVFAAAKRLRVTVNDLLLASAFLAVNDWRKRYELSRDNWMRMLAPADMRTPEQRGCAAGNIVSGYFLDRSAADMEDPHGLLMDVHREMALGKKRRFAQMFLLGSMLCRYLPGGLRKQVLANKCLVSMFLTNLGRLFVSSPLAVADGRLVAGDVTVDAVEILPPIRPYACANFGASTYANELTLTLHYDLRPLSHAHARDLLAALTQRVRSWCVSEVEAAEGPALAVS